MKNKLKEARKEKGLSQVEVAKKAKISERTYQRYENGERLPDVLTALIIADILNSAVEELFPLYDNTKER